MDVRYLIGIVLIVAGVAQIKFRKKFQEWEIRRGQADVDTFPSVPFLSSFFSFRRDLARDTFAQLSIIIGVGMIIAGTIIILAAISGYRPPLYW